MTTTQQPSTQATREALMLAAQRKAEAEQAANAARTRKLAKPASDPMAEQLAAMQQQMAQFAALLAQKDEQIAELKKAGPAKKAEKPAPSPENMTIDLSGSILTIRVDLSKSTGKKTANGANEIIAQQNAAVGPYHVTYAGKDHWLSCCIARPLDNAKELRAAYRASKKAQ